MRIFIQRFALAFGAIILFMSNISPEEIPSNLSYWYKFVTFGSEPPLLLKNPLADEWATTLFGVVFFVSTVWIFWPKIAKFFNKRTPIQTTKQVNEKVFAEGTFDLLPNENYHETQYGTVPNGILEWAPKDKVWCRIEDGYISCERLDINKAEEIQVYWHINER